MVKLFEIELDNAEAGSFKLKEETDNTGLVPESYFYDEVVAKHAFDIEADKIDELVHIVETFQTVHTSLQRASLNKGMTALEAAAINQCVSHMFKRAGVAPYSVVAMENMHSPVYSRWSCKVAAESLWENIKATIKKIIDWIKSLFTSANKASAKVIEHVYSLENKIKICKEKLKNKKGILLKDKQLSFPITVSDFFWKNNKMMDVHEITFIAKEFEKDILNKLLPDYINASIDALNKAHSLIETNKGYYTLTEEKEFYFDKVRKIFSVLKKVHDNTSHGREKYEYELFATAKIEAELTENHISLLVLYNDELTYRGEVIPPLSIEDMYKIIMLLENIDSNKIADKNKKMIHDLTVIKNILIDECDIMSRNINAANEERQEKLSSLKFFTRIYSSIFNANSFIDRYYVNITYWLLQYCNRSLTAYE